MEWRANITDAETFMAALHRLGCMPHPFNIVVNAGEGDKRGISQNGLFHAWMGQIAKSRGDVSEARVKAECHIQWGIPILRAEDPEYAGFIKAALGGRSYEECCDILEKGFVPCTSLMSKPQMSRYMNFVWDAYAPHVRLMDPAELKWRAAA